MNKLVTGVIIAAVLLIIVPPAQAAMVGSIDTNIVSEEDASAGYDISALRPSGLASLTTTVASNGPSIIRYGNYLYFTCS